MIPCHVPRVLCPFLTRWIWAVGSWSRALFGRVAFVALLWWDCYLYSHHPNLSKQRLRLRQPGDIYVSHRVSTQWLAFERTALQEHSSAESLLQKACFMCLNASFGMKKWEIFYSSLEESMAHQCKRGRVDGLVWGRGPLTDFVSRRCFCLAGMGLCCMRRRVLSWARLILLQPCPISKQRLMTQSSQQCQRRVGWIPRWIKRDRAVKRTRLAQWKKVRCKARTQFNFRYDSKNRLAPNWLFLITSTRSTANNGQYRFTAVVGYIVECSGVCC